MEMEESVGPVNLQKRRIKKLVQESKKLYLCAVAELDSNIREGHLVIKIWYQANVMHFYFLWNKYSM
jgi:hypothetical protein